MATYDREIKYGNIRTDSGWTYGGYCERHTVPERFIIRIPDGFPLESAGPVFCAGITMYSPLTRWGADKVMTSAESRSITDITCNMPGRD